MLSALMTSRDETHVWASGTPVSAGKSARYAAGAGNTMLVKARILTWNRCWVFSPMPIWLTSRDNRNSSLTLATLISLSSLARSSVAAVKARRDYTSPHRAFLGM